MDGKTPATKFKGGNKKMSGRGQEDPVRDRGILNSDGEMPATNFRSSDVVGSGVGLNDAKESTANIRSGNEPGVETINNSDNVSSGESYGSGSLDQLPTNKTEPLKEAQGCYFIIMNFDNL